MNHSKHWSSLTLYIKHSLVPSLNKSFNNNAALTNSIHELHVARYQVFLTIPIPNARNVSLNLLAGYTLNSN